MTTNNSSAPIGHAIYLEFVKQNVTTQILIMPEGQSSSHKLVAPTIYRRRMTPNTRKTWRTSSAFTTAHAERMTNPLQDSSIVVDRVLSGMQPLLRSLVLNSFTLYQKPIVVEVTAEDLEQVLFLRTPYKVIGRVTKVRKALGFPKEIVHPVPTSPAPGI